MSKHYHFIGIGGAGMSAIAQILHQQGCSVSGSDQKESQVTERLRVMGIKVSIGHDAASVNGATLVVYSAAIPEDNAERVRAKERGIEIIDRAEMLGRLMQPYTHRVAVTGTHGKTTTTSMVSLVLQEAGLEPTVLVGGDVESLGGNAKLGSNSVIVAEACEAFNSFLHLYPSIAVITNVDADHLDFHGTLDAIKDSFRKFISQIDKDGCLIACIDDPGVQEVTKDSPVELIGYSVKGPAGFEARSIRVDGPHARYMLVRDGQELGEIELGITGLQYVANSLAAAAVGFELGASFEQVRLALGKYKGTGRRLETLGEAHGVMVIDDYAHHPKEIEATLTAVKASQPGRRIVAVFQPHLYSRTQIFLKDFASALSVADYVVVTGIYAAREKPIVGVSAESIAELLRSSGKSVEYIEQKDRIPEFLKSAVRSGDTVLTMGAGDIRQVGERLLDLLRQ
jgi:UDP-N-acetylmuramate--alanine ligase